MIYLVAEQGVYRHRILGVYDTQEQAEARALEVASKEDGYHSYGVWKAAMNTGFDDPALVCEYQKEQIGHSWPRQYTEPKRQSGDQQP
jgi:hypothetical protein